MSKINSRQPSLKRAKTLETVNAQKSLAKSASLRSAPSLERKPTFKIDEETEAVARDVDERLNEEMSAVVKDEDETKNKKFLFSLKSNVFRTASMKARARGESMRWVDRLALYYLALEMVVKLAVILAGSAQIAGDISVYGLVTVHWFSALFVFICQPWRIITLGFGQRKVNNALNKTESSAGFLQGAIPLIGLLLATDSSLTGLSTGFLLTLIVCLLCVRVFFIVSERFAVKTEKWNFEKEPEETAMKVNRKFIELGVAGKIVGIYALKAQVAVQRRKVRARLEATREAMLSKIETMRTAEHADESQITALLGIANEMAVIVNACTVQPYPEGLDPQRQIDSAMDLLEKLLADADGELARRQGEPTANALYLLLRVHAYDRAIKQLDDDMLVYAQSECVNELVTLGQQVSLLRDEQATLREPFGTEELNRVTLQLHADVFTDTLAPRAESDDLEGVLAVLDTVHQIAVKHETWRDECVELLEHPEDHELIGGDIEVTRIAVDGAVYDLKNHDVHISQLIEYCAMDWQQYFKNFGKKRYARTLREMTDVAVKAINAGDTSALETELSTRVEEFVAWCVSASEGIAHCGFGKRNLGIGRVAHDSLRAFVDKKSNKLQPLALKRAKAHQEARLFQKPLRRRRTIGVRRRIQRRRQRHRNRRIRRRALTKRRRRAERRNRNRNRLRRTFPSPTPTSTSTHPPTRKRAHHVGIYVFHLFIASRPIPSPRRSTGARVSPPGPRAPRGNQTTLSTVTDVTFERARVRPSRAFDAPRSRDMTRDFLVPDSFADLCVDDDGDGDETRGVVARWMT